VDDLSSSAENGVARIKAGELDIWDVRVEHLVMDKETTMNSPEKEVAKCRGCGLELRGKSYCYGGSAYHPKTGEPCKINFYGGYVCSEGCDFKSSLELERTMPGHRCSDTRLSQGAKEHYDRNWRESPWKVG
jgi:hypothetical protein